MRLIDADELKKHTVKVCFHKAPECGAFDAVVVYEIDIMPTINPESLRPTAHWDGEATRYVDGVLVYDVWHCSKCAYTIDDGTDNKNDLPNYCPHCGARMVNTDEKHCT